MTMRKIERIVRGRATSDGAGVRLTRIIGAPELPDLDPFLMLDEFGSDDPNHYIGGFPDHPHRGFETVTYLLAGEVAHADSAGHRGTLTAGSVQWMTAGRGVVHSEMPRMTEGLLRGFQLWVNLPAARKMDKPAYREFSAGSIPTASVAGGRVKVIAGRFGDVIGPVAAVAVDPIYFDVTVAPGGSVTVPAPADHDGFVYLYEGGGTVGERPMVNGELGVLGAGEALELVGGDGGLSALLVAGRPIGEPVARYGPFVMNSVAEIERAFDDYRNGRLAE
jgi:redox-sensitive bicupin YhaK (pirin superfamily)